MTSPMWQWVGRIYFIVIVVFLFFPILIVLPLSFSDSQFLTFPPPEFGVRWYRAYLQDPIWIEATLRSLRVGFSAACLATLSGTLGVLWLTRTRTRAKVAVNALFLAPAIIPNIVIALGVFVLAIRTGLNDTEFVLVLAHAMLAIPFVVLIVGAAIRQIDPNLERAARVMGAGPIQAFRHATLPGLTPAIAAAWIFAFFISFDELVIALFLSGGQMTLPVRIWSDLRFEINPTIAAVASLFVVFTTLGMTAAELLRRRSLR